MWGGIHPLHDEQLSDRLELHRWQLLRLCINLVRKQEGEEKTEGWRERGGSTSRSTGGSTAVGGVGCHGNNKIKDTQLVWYATHRPDGRYWSGRDSMFEENSTSNGPIAILEEVLASKEEIFEHRRWFHAHPELSFQEIQTAAKVVEILRNIGITEIWEGVGRTGVVALIRGGKPGKCVALRADMDALPIQETSDLPFRSQNDGAMHACGHDGHMAGLLAAAKVLFAERVSISGVVKLIFQPAEEGYAGAPAMINDGCLEDGPMGPNVDEIYGLHLWSCEYLLLASLFLLIPPALPPLSQPPGRDRLQGWPRDGFLRQVLN
jgi:hypothetical protein